MSKTSAGRGIIPSMDFPIADLFDDDLSTAWLLKYFHQNELKCPYCGKSMEEARVFRTTKRSGLTVYRCSCKKYLSGYVAMCEFGINLKRVTPAFISALVAQH